MSSDIMPMADARPRRQRGQGSGATDAALLFDEPGPRGRILIAIGSVFAVIGIAALVGAVLYRLDLAGQLDYPEWRYFLAWGPSPPSSPSLLESPWDGSVCWTTAP